MSIKHAFRQKKKLPDWMFIPPALLLRCLKALMRTEIVDPGGRMDPSTYPYVTVTWHNRLLFFPAMFPKQARTRTTALISASRDGQYVADLVKRFGIESVRGSSSRRGAMALDGAIKHLERGRNVSVTPDGPRGPRYEMSLGPIALASKTGVPILPVAVNYSSYWELKSWDRFQIPKPWAKITLVLGDPIEIPRGLSKEEMEPWRKTVQEKLDAISGVKPEDRGQ
jgi:lysophospholipid acyltransferase (LPLAT)-like uncharacterized protein